MNEHIRLLGEGCFDGSFFSCQIVSNELRTYSNDDFFNILAQTCRGRRENRLDFNPSEKFTCMTKPSNNVTVNIAMKLYKVLFRPKLSVIVLMLSLVPLFFPLIADVPSESIARNGKTMVYFYSSETNINNYTSLKTEFDKYLSRFGSYEFQPFNDRKTFEQEAKNRNDALLILSSWHFQLIKAQFGLVPLRVGLRNGNYQQKRILVVSDRKYNNSIADLTPVASASSVPHTRSVLEKVLRKHQALDSLRILPVPKDIDALMSVGFQMSHSALVTDHSLKNLADLDPVLHEKLNAVNEGVESMLLMMAAPATAADEVHKLVTVIENMPEDADGLNILKMLDLDGWKVVDPSDLSKLEA